MKKNYYYIAGLLSIVTFASFSQPSVKTSLVASVSNTDRISLVKTSIPLTEWHEKAFWSQYKNYLDTIQAVSLRTYLIVQELAQNDKTINDREALEKGRSMISCHVEDLSLKNKFFKEIGLEHNGVIGLQFLQTEFMLDLMESFRNYEMTPLKNFNFRANGLSTNQFQQAKYNTIIKALSLSPEEAAIFLPVYSRYERESEEILGEEYNMYELFAGEASDFTPALAKRQGNDLLTIMDRENKLKEKYFDEMTSVAGPYLASRFLAWEDYYSITCKLEAWTESR